jgi:hypothetical protein
MLRHWGRHHVIHYVTFVAFIFVKLYFMLVSASGTKKEEEEEEEERDHLTDYISCVIMYSSC